MNQNQNMVQNPKKEVPKTKEMNDKDYITCILETEKNMAKNYAVALNEASNEPLFEDYFTMFQDIQKMQRNLYELMFQKGWYPLERADATKVEQKYNQLSGEQEELE